MCFSFSQVTLINNDLSLKSVTNYVRIHEYHGISRLQTLKFASMLYKCDVHVTEVKTELSIKANPLQITKSNSYDSGRKQSYVYYFNSSKVIKKLVSLQCVIFRQAHTSITWTLLCFLPQPHGLTHM